MTTPTPTYFVSPEAVNSGAKDANTSEAKEQRRDACVSECSKKVLLLEDVPVHQANFLIAMSKILSADKYHICVVYNAEGAIALLEKIKFDLIVTDHDMPNATGSDLIEYLNSKNLGIPIVTYSGRPEANEMMCANYRAGKSFNFHKFDVINGKANSLIVQLLNNN